MVVQRVDQWICCRGFGALQASKTGTQGGFQARRHCVGKGSFEYLGASAGLYRFRPTLVYP